MHPRRGLLVLEVKDWRLSTIARADRQTWEILPDGVPKTVINPLEQARQYAKGQKCQFVILSNGNHHYFWDLEAGNPNPVAQLPSLEMLQSRLQYEPDSLSLTKEKIATDYIVTTQYPDYAKDPGYVNEKTRPRLLMERKLRFLRPYQIAAIQAIQHAVAEGKDRFLLEMATGTGKTLTAAAILKLFLRTKNARRILFLVDRLELAANFLGGICFQIVHVLVGRCPDHVNHDHGFVGLADTGGLFRSQKSRQRKPP